MLHVGNFATASPDPGGSPFLKGSCRVFHFPLPVGSSIVRVLGPPSASRALLKEGEKYGRTRANAPHTSSPLRRRSHITRKFSAAARRAKSPDFGATLLSPSHPRCLPPAPWPGPQNSSRGRGVHFVGSACPPAQSHEWRCFGPKYI